MCHRVNGQTEHCRARNDESTPTARMILSGNGYLEIWQTCPWVIEAFEADAGLINIAHNKILRLRWSAVSVSSSYVFQGLYRGRFSAAIDSSELVRERQRWHRWNQRQLWAGIKAKGRVHLKNALDRRSRNRGLCGRIRPPHLFARISSQRNHFFYLPSVLEDDCKYAQRNRSRKARRFSHMSGLQHAGNVLCRYAERGARLTAQDKMFQS
jgi:hypothetical protein